MPRILFIAAVIILCASGIAFYFFNTGKNHGRSGEGQYVDAVRNAEGTGTAADTQPYNQTADTKDLPLVLTTEYRNEKNNPELVERARDLMESGNKSQKIRAFHVLMEMTPSEAAGILRDLIPKAKTDGESAELLAHGLVGFAQSTEYLTSADLKSSFAIDNKNVQKISALIMQDRGDDSLVKQYMDTTAAGLKDKNPEVRSQALKEIVSVGFDRAVPYALESLKDSEETNKRNALDFLSQYATSNDISKIEPALNDPNKEISQYAKEIIDTLWKKNTNEVIPLSERLVQPGFPVGKLSLNLDE